MHTCLLTQRFFPCMLGYSWSDSTTSGFATGGGFSHHSNITRCMSSGSICQRQGGIVSPVAQHKIFMPFNSFTYSPRISYLFRMPLHTACRYCSSNEEVINMLIEANHGALCTRTRVSALYVSLQARHKGLKHS